MVVSNTSGGRWKFLAVVLLIIAGLWAYSYMGSRESCKPAYPSVYYTLTPPHSGEAAAFLPPSGNLEALSEAMVQAFNETHNPNYVVSLANLSVGKGLVRNSSLFFTYRISSGGYTACGHETTAPLPPHTMVVGYPKKEEFDALFGYVLLENGSERALVVFYILPNVTYGEAEGVGFVYPSNWTVVASSEEPLWECHTRGSITTCDEYSENVTPYAHSGWESIGIRARGRIGAGYVVFTGDGGAVGDVFLTTPAGTVGVSCGKV